MGRFPRVYIEGVLYYVTSKGGHGQDTFTHLDDYKEYVELIDKYKKQYGFNLFSYALMPNHLHMLIELKENIGISNIMHDINSLYTKKFNSRYNRKGHLFQERFKAVIAEKEAHLLQLVRHIHLNPVRMGMVEKPEDYPHSSHNKYLDQDKRSHPDMNREVEEVFRFRWTARRYVEHVVAVVVPPGHLDEERVPGTPRVYAVYGVQAGNASCHVPPPPSADDHARPAHLDHAFIDVPPCPEM